MTLTIPTSLVLLSLASSALAQTLSPASSSEGASIALDPSFAGFGIEPSNLFSFTGHGSANELSINLLQNLADYAGLPPHLRIGGNTGDYMIYDSSYSYYALETNANTGPNAPNKYTFGPTYFTAIDRFPQNTPITYGLNLAYEDSDFVDRIVAEATAAVENLNNVHLYSFEIGNEPDLYHENGFRDVSYGGANYVAEFLERASAVYEQVLKPRGMPAKFFEPPATASTIGTTFEITDLVNDGIQNGVNGSGTFVSGWNQHDYFYFISVSTYGLTIAELMDLQRSESQFEYWAGQVAIALNTGLPYYLREMASVGPTGIQGISDTFASSLWTLNWLCYMATLNVSSVQFHMTDNSYSAAWAPIEQDGLAPHVRPGYYAMAAMAQLIGTGNGTTQIALVTPDGLTSDYTDYVRVYSAYFAGDLGAIVIINSQPSNVSTSPKEGVTFTIENLPANNKLYLSYLTAAGADSTSGVEWNGISFEQGSVGKAQTVNSTIATVDIDGSGKATVYVEDSTAIIANIGYQLGSNAVSIANGSGSSSKKSSATSTGQAATATGTPHPNAASTTPTATHTSKSTAVSLHESDSVRRFPILPIVIAIGAGLFAARGLC